jgi:hypothetical protein
MRLNARMAKSIYRRDAEDAEEAQRLASKLKTSMVYGRLLDLIVPELLYEIDTRILLSLLVVAAIYFITIGRNDLYRFIDAAGGCDSVVCRQLSKEVIGCCSPVQNSMVVKL